MSGSIPALMLAKMKAGICPVCDEPMMRGNKQTHTKNKRKYCEDELRKKLDIQRQTIKVGDKTYEVNGTYMNSEDAKKLKEKQKKK